VYDFVRLTETFDGTPVALRLQTGANSWDTILPTQTSDDEYIFILGFYSQSYISSYPNGTMYLIFMNEMNTDITDFTFNLEGFVLQPADAMMWDDEQIYIITILICDILLIIGFIFTTNFVDIAIDHTSAKKKGSKRRK
jgi:hypothetical protein